MTAPRSATGRWAAMQSRWAQLAPKEKAGVGLAFVVVLLAVLWMGIIGPGLAQWRTAEAKGRALDAQLQTMQTLQAQVQSIQAQPPLGYDDAVRALKQATLETLGATAQVSPLADRATVTLQSAQPEALALWLTQARLNGRSVPLEAHLTRAPGADGVLWNGTLTMSLPAK